MECCLFNTNLLEGHKLHLQKTNFGEGTCLLCENKVYLCCRACDKISQFLSQCIQVHKAYLIEPRGLVKVTKISNKYF